MKSAISYFLRLIIFWLLFFAIGRIFFLLLGLQRIESETVLEIVWSFIAALRLDLTTVSYLLIFPLLFFWVQNLLPFGIYKLLLKIYHYILIVAFVLITISGARLFLEWGSLLNYRAMVFLFEPDSVTGSVALWDLLKMIIIAVSFIALIIYLFHKIIRFPENYPFKNKLVFSALLTVLLLVGMRGGLQKKPITESVVYYSDNIYLNNAATNPVWYLTHSVNQASLNNKERYTTMSDSRAEELLNEIFPNGETEYILKENAVTPNIIIIILESWSVDLIERLGGVKDATPVFDSLSMNGILFGNIYSSGFRTDQGLVSLFSGFPAQPSHSIIQNLEKVLKLPFMPLMLKNIGYESSFYYGGNIKFSNMKSYLEIAGFNYIYGGDYFRDEKIKFTNWGAHDEYVLLQQARDLSKLQQPFFSTVLTLSTHEPYDVPLPLPTTKLTEPEKYIRSAHYTDYALGKYFEYARTQPWFSNTLFILTADHGHRLPGNYSAFNKEIRHMPVLFYGEVIKKEDRGNIITTIGNLHDLPETILQQLHIDTPEFVWSKDLLDKKTKSFAYIGYEKGFGWVYPPSEYLLYLYPQGQITQSGKLETNPTPDSIIQYPKAYIQRLYKQFIAM